MCSLNRKRVAFLVGAVDSAEACLPLALLLLLVHVVSDVLPLISTACRLALEGDDVLWRIILPAALAVESWESL